jgi:fibronectin-binding autotransporter adhesin
MTARISVSGAFEIINVLAYDDTGQTINATIASEDTGTIGDSVDATFLTNGNYVVAYIKNDQPVFQVRDSANATVVSTTVVEASMTAGDSISVEPTTGGGFRVTWTADNGGDNDIFSQLFDSAGNASGAMETITATGADATDLDTAILSDGSGVSVHVEGGQVILTTGSDTGSGATTTPSVELQNGATIGGSGVLVNESEIDSDGTVTLASDATLRNAGTFTQASGVLEIDGTFDNQAEGTLLATGDIELASGASLSNAGIIRATDGAEVTLSSTNIDNTGGTIEIIGGASSSELHIRDNITLGGVLHLSEDASDQDNDADITVSNGDTLTITGTLKTSSDSDPGTNDHDLYGTYDNQGTFSLDHDLHLNSGGRLDTSDGEISLSNGVHLHIDGDLLVGGDTTLTGQGTIVIYDDLRVGNGESFTHSDGVQIIVDGGELDGTGSFTNQGTIVFGSAEGTMSPTGSISANIFDNLGLIQVQGGTLLVETDGFENASVGIEGATGTIELKASSDTAVLKLDEDFDNSGLIDLAGDFSNDHARITHDSGETLTNQSTGTIQVSGGEVTGDRVFDVDIENLGLVAVGANATLTSGHVLDTSSGTVSIQTSQELDARGTVLVGDNTDFQGSGTIDFGSLGALSLADSEVYTYDPAAVTLDFTSGGTIKGDGTLRNDGELDLSGAEVKDGTFDNNGTLELTAANFQDGVIDNDGTILIDGTTSTTLAATSFDNTGGLIDMRSDEGDSTLVLADDLTVTGGVLSLDAWAGGNDTAYLDVGAHTLTMDGTLLSKSTDGDVDDANVLTGTGEVINTGTIDVDIDLRVASDMTLDAKDAQVAVATGASLDVNGVLEVGDDTVFSGDGTVRVGSGASLQVTAGEPSPLKPGPLPWT